ncbi:MAG: hypothetical protein OXQ90_20205 [Gammaproteobacteria bacterium]|nr:hypothetical protein [Gammaproteobacteria bacterium]
MDIKEKWAAGLRSQMVQREAGASPGTRSEEPVPLDSFKETLDELFTLTSQYRTGRAYAQLLRFTARFRSYSPYNALLVHTQMPGATYVAPPSRWLAEYGREIRPGAHPIIVLRPGGPVMFVFDVKDTEPGPNARPIPDGVLAPFAARGSPVGSQLRLVITNAKRDGVRVSLHEEGSQSAGSIRSVSRATRTLVFKHGVRKPRRVRVPLRYELLVSRHLATESRFATVAHELAHLYCGHLGTPDDRWWPDRRHVSPHIMELEAESVSYLVCRRFGVESPAASYLARYLRDNEPVPEISLERVMVTAGLIETMSTRPMRPRS